MSAITTSSGSTCPSHQESAWGAAKTRQERFIVEVVKTALLPGDAGVFVEHIYKTFLSVLSPKSTARRPPKRSSLVEHLPSFLAVAHHHTGHEEDY